MLPQSDVNPNELIRRKINLRVVVCRRRLMVLDWKPAPEAKEKPSDPMKVRFQRLTTEELGQALSKWRMDQNLTLREAASKLGISHVAVWAFEKGKKRLPLRLWVAIRGSQ